MRIRWIVLATALVITVAHAMVSAREHKALPAGPIADRHELMEGIGKNAKVISDTMKSGDFTPVAGAAEKIQAAATRITSLFPPGSTHPDSRAKPEIWSQWPKFETGAKQLETTAGALAAAAKSGGNVPAGAKTLFGSCKSCHEQFRIPDTDEK